MKSVNLNIVKKQSNRLGTAKFLANLFETGTINVGCDKKGVVYAALIPSQENADLIGKKRVWLIETYTNHEDNRLSNHDGSFYRTFLSKSQHNSIFEDVEYTEACLTLFESLIETLKDVLRAYIDSEQTEDSQDTYSVTIVKE